jgi:HPr kinase/phosphorylase
VPPTAGTDETIVHGTAIAAGGRAVLIRGPSGAGKSDLALRAIAMGGNALVETNLQLVADDQVVVRRAGEGVTVSAPAALAGLIEVRGAGIVSVPYTAAAQLELIAELTGAGGVERYPDPWPYAEILGVRMPVLRIAPFEASAPLKLALALARTPWWAQPG